MNFRVKICNYIQIYTKVHIIVYNSALADSGALNAPSVVTHIRWIKDEQAFFSEMPACHQSKSSICRSIGVSC